MDNLLDSKIRHIVLHEVGNKSNDDDLLLSADTVETDEEMDNLLKSYFLTPFKTNEYYNFYHDIDLSMNEVYTCAAKIFDNSDEIVKQSANIAKHLFEQSIHPKIKGGEFYTVYFDDCIFNNEKTAVIGLFKSENKDTFLKVHASYDNFEIESEKGININKLDKGCLIFNKERENGFIVSVIDNTNRGADAQYWIDDFLHVRQRKDEYYNTQNLLTLTKNFITKELPQQFEVSKADQVDMLNKSVNYFKANEEFGLTEFANEIMSQPEVINCFNEYKSAFEVERNVQIADRFEISDSAVKKQARVFRNVIKLDKNFHIYVHGNRELIEQGVDEKGRKFYKIYYDEEM